MEAADHYREFVLSALVEDTPEKFWRRFGERTLHAYGEAFSAVAGDPTLLPEQREQKLYQERYYKMEHALVSAAADAGIPASAKLIGINRCYYAYAAKGRFGVTQSYVQVSGGMPTPSQFRTQIAEMAAFKRASRLDLGDEPTELITPKQVCGIMLHSPVGKKFSEDDQKLGAVGFFVAYEDYGSWAVELALSEILAAYAPAETRADRVQPIRRQGKKTGTEEA